jgi:hypothetical protein
MTRATGLVVAAAILIPAAASGQSRAGQAVPNAPAPRDPLPRFTIPPRGGALQPIGLPLPPAGLPPPSQPAPLRRHGWRGAYYPYWPTAFFYAPPVYLEPAPAPEPAAPPMPEAPGKLFLDIQPGDAQIFADGYYVGVAEDFGVQTGGGLIPPGVHRLDVSAPGYEPAAIDLKITSGQTLTYKASLKTLAAAPAIPRSTFYLIPGCYMGNVPPQDASLPPTCDQRRATIWQP